MLMAEKGDEISISDLVQQISSLSTTVSRLEAKLEATGTRPNLYQDCEALNSAPTPPTDSGSQTVTVERSSNRTEPTRVGTEPKPVPLLRHSLGTINTTKCKRYNSRYLDPGCCGVDALHQSDWAREMNFVNAPLRLLDSVLNIILHQEAEATIIAPAWKAKNWFQKLKKLSIASPIKLPHARTFCIQRGLRPPEALKNPKWVWFACRISGRRH
ncbi:reverse transcriptase [Plakobranchus ocellatus]|uniref:Reverse transcriptase n=1 Tax=Plakobranchus ocellatus TaxID=259542 RepID=A0AAV4BSY7_9GAST|nr:reverse transcriptase [Plakobranchus ocellatus]